MAYIYIGLVDTPGIFAGLIRRTLQQKYIHVVLSMDAELEEAYSIGRRNPEIPILAGFEKENKYRIIGVFPNADYMVCRITCSDEQKQLLRKKLADAYIHRKQYHYTILGLPFILLNRPFYQKNHYTCSSYLAKLFQETGIWDFGKHFSLVTPKDFLEWDQKEIIFEGSLRQLIRRPAYEVAYEQ